MKCLPQCGSYMKHHTNEIILIIQTLCCGFLVTVQLPGEDGYSGGKVIFIDTENTLYPYNYYYNTNIAFTYAE